MTFFKITQQRQGSLFAHHYVPNVLCTKHTILLFNKSSTKGISIDDRNPFKYLLKLVGYSEYLSITL